MTSSVDRLGFAVIGCGTAAWTGHLPWIWGNPLASLNAVCDRNLDAARQAQTRFGTRRATADFNEVLADPAVDAVSICTPPATHATLAIAALEHGKHVLLEKPMARSLEECDRISNCARAHGARLMLAHEKRFSPAAQKIRDIIASGEIGTVFHLSVNWGAAVKLAPDRLIPPGYGDGYRWRWTDPDVGGGILQDHLPHYVDLWRWWTGSEVETVCTEAQHVSRDLLEQPELGLWEDYGTVLMRFRSGAVGTFQTGTAGRALSPILHIGSGIGEWSEFGYVFGSRGQIAFDFPPWDSAEIGRVMVWSLEGRGPRDRGWYQVEFPDPRRSPGGPLSPVTNESHMFYRQLDSFIRCIRENTAAPVSIGDGRATLAVIEAAYRSSETGQKVSVKA